MRCTDGKGEIGTGIRGTPHKILTAENSSNLPAKTGQTRRHQKVPWPRGGRMARRNRDGSKKPSIVLSRSQWAEDGTPKRSRQYRCQRVSAQNKYLPVERRLLPVKRGYGGQTRGRGTGDGGRGTGVEARNPGSGLVSYLFRLLFDFWPSTHRRLSTGSHSIGNHRRLPAVSCEHALPVPLHRF